MGIPEVTTEEWVICRHHTSMDQMMISLSAENQGTFSDYHNRATSGDDYVYGTLEDGLFGAGWASRTTTTVLRTGCNMYYYYTSTPIFKYYPLHSDRPWTTSSHPTDPCPSGYHSWKTGTLTSYRAYGCYHRFSTYSCPILNSHCNTEGRPYSESTTTTEPIAGSLHRPLV